MQTTATGAGGTTLLILETPESIGVLDLRSVTVTATVPRPDVSQINAALFASDSIWVTDHDGNAVLRLDAETGRTLARVEIEGQAVSLLDTEEGVWAGSDVYPASVSLIDPATNRTVRKLELGAFPAYGLGSLWFGRNEIEVSTAVRRVDPVTGDVLSTIEMVGGQQGCYVGGSFPDAAWSWCFERLRDTVPVRLDVETNKTVATVELGSGGGLIGVAGDTSWFFADPKNGLPPRLVRVDNETNAIDRVYVNPVWSTIAEGKLWLVDAKAGELQSIALDDL